MKINSAHHIFFTISVIFFFFFFLTISNSNQRWRLTMGNWMGSTRKPTCLPKSKKNFAMTK